MKVQRTTSCLILTVQEDVEEPVCTILGFHRLLGGPRRLDQHSRSATMRQHQIERKFAKADFAAVVLREWNDKLDQLKVTQAATLSPSPVLSIKDGDATRQWFKVIELHRPRCSADPTLKKFRPQPSYDKELKVGDLRRLFWQVGCGREQDSGLAD
jgi:hypothetical protein